MACSGNSGGLLGEHYDINVQTLNG